MKCTVCSNREKLYILNISHITSHVNGIYACYLCQNHLKNSKKAFLDLKKYTIYYIISIEHRFTTNV